MNRNDISHKRSIPRARGHFPGPRLSRNHRCRLRPRQEGQGVTAPTKEDLLARKKAAEAELERLKLEAEVKALEKQTRKPSLIGGVLRVYVKAGKAAINGVGAMVDELNKPPENNKKGGKKSK